MAGNQPFGAKPASQDHRAPISGVDSFANEGGGQRRISGGDGQSDLRHDAELAVKSAKETLGNVRDMAGDVYESAKSGATTSVKSINDAVHHNPWASVGIAAGVGLFLGLLLNRIRS